MNAAATQEQLANAAAPAHDWIRSSYGVGVGFTERRA